MGTPHDHLYVHNHPYLGVKYRCSRDESCKAECSNSQGQVSTRVASKRRRSYAHNLSFIPTKFKHLRNSPVGILQSQLMPINEDIDYFIDCRIRH